MAIPTLLLPLDGDLEGRDRDGLITATGHGALRWAPGMGGAPASRNLVRNPSFEDGTINGTSIADTGIVRSITTEDAYHGTHAFRVDSNGTDAGFEAGVYSTSITGLNTMGGAYTSQIWAKVPAGYTCYFTHRVYYTDDTSAQLSLMDEQVATGDWQYFEVTNYPRSDKILDRILALFKVRNVTSPMYYLLDACQTERGEVATPYFDGDSGPGHGWEGTQHDSASYREAWVHGGAVFLDESTTNYIANPLVGTGTNDISIVGVDEEDVLRDSPADKQGRYGLTVLCDGGQTHQGVTYYTPNGIGIEEGEPITIAADFGLTGDEPGRFWAIVHFTDSTNATTTVVRVAPNVGVKRIVIPTYTVPAGKTVDRVAVNFRTNASTAGVLRIGGVQVEKKAYPTSQVPQVDREGNLLPGYSWTGTEHASPSTRDAASIELEYPHAFSEAVVRYSEDDGETWQTESIHEPGAFGTYGTLDLSDGVLTIGVTSHAVLIDQLIVFDRPLTEPERTLLMNADSWEWQMLYPRLGGVLRVDGGGAPFSVLRSGYGEG